jgi:beta-barrel assembly-enhancing protease
MKARRSRGERESGVRRTDTLHALGRPVGSLLVAVLVVALAASPLHALSVGDEKKMGKEVSAKFLAELGQSDDAAAREFIRRIGQRLVRASQPQLFDFQFYLVKDNAINAFAVPGGYVFVNTGLVAAATSEEEVAGVLAHEMGHVTARHISQQITRSTAISVLSLATMLGAVFLAKNPKTAAAMSSAAMAGSSAMQLKYSREMEEQADRLGFQTMIRAGYNPTGMVTFMKKLMAESAGSEMIPSYLTDHPGTTQRVVYLEGLAETARTRLAPMTDPAPFQRVHTRVLVEQKDPETAVTYFAAEVRDHPGDVNALYGLALAYQKAGRVADAQATFRQALAAAPKDADVLRDLGISLLLAGKAADGMEFFRQAVAIRPTDGLTYYYLGLAQKEGSDFKTAAVSFQRAVDDDPENVEAMYNLGISLGNAGEECRAFYFLGVYYRKVGDPRQARVYLERALTVCPSQNEFKAKTDQEIQTLNTRAD